MAVPGGAGAEPFDVRLGLFTVGFAVPGSFSLKDKRQVLRRILGKAKGSREAFNVSVAEVAALDDPRRAVVAVSAVSNAAEPLFRLFEALRRFFESFGDIVVEGVRTEVIPVTVDEPLHAAEKYGEGLGTRG